MAYLKDVAEIVMGQSPSGDRCYVTERGLPLLNGPTEFGSHHPIPTQWTDDPKRHATPGDLLFCVRGSTTGRMNWADQDYAIGRGLAAIRHRSGVKFQPWIRGVIEAQLSGLLNAATGSTFPNVSKDQLHNLEVPDHSPFEQEGIAGILGALDDKIELNRRMAAALEEMARALYRSWFVDFDPVKAKAEGLAPTFMDEATAALFPDRFGDDGLPEGWSQVGLPEIATFLNGAALQKFPPAEGEESLPVIKIAELRNGVTSNSNRASVNLPSKYHIENGDVLFSWSGSLLQKVWTDGPGALNQHLFKVSSARVPKWFHFFAVDQHMDEFRQIAQSKATTMGHIQRQHLDAALVCVSDSAVMKRADKIIGGLFDRMVALNIENRTLAALRDALLPKLMSGEIRVGTIENHIEAIA